MTRTHGFPVLLAVCLGCAALAGCFGGDGASDEAAKDRGQDFGPDLVDVVGIDPVGDPGSVDNGIECTPGDSRQGEAACFPPDCSEGWACPQGVPTGCISSGCSCTSDRIWVCLPDCNHTIACVVLADLAGDALMDSPGGLDED